MRISILGIIFFLFFSNNLIIGQSGNPFDIQGRNLDTLITNDTLSEPTIPTETNTLSKSYLQRQQEKLMNDNPFNVSHLPLREKKPLVKEEVSIADITEDVVPEKEVTFIPTEKLNNLTKKGGNKFIFWVLFVQLLLLTSLMGVNRGFIGKLWRSINNDNFAKLIARDFNNGYSSSFALLYPIFVFSFSLFIYLAMKYFGDFSGIRVYGFLFLSIAVVYVIRHIYHGIVASIYPFRKNIVYFNFTIILFNCVLGLILIPINLSVAYGPEWLSVFSLYFGFFIVGIAFLLRYLRGVLDAFTILRNHVIHFFIYLCTCEIAPVFFLVKFLSKSFVN